MTLSALTAISPLDGRYARQTQDLQNVFSEMAFMRCRVKVEVEWLIGLSELGWDELPLLSGEDQAFLRGLVDNFTESDCAAIKEIERTTNHDVKAVEYWIKDQVMHHDTLKAACEFVHFACTSEDINNTSHALMLKDGVKLYLARLDETINTLRGMAHTWADEPMLSRTHGQTASPTTVGKEIANFVKRLQDRRVALSNLPLLAKMNGAVGNFNAHVVAYPNVDWEAFAKRIIETRLEITFNSHSIQIEHHDYMAALFQEMTLIHTILLDLDRDMWGYISQGYFRQKLKEGEVGSSTMPHKVNPIDFENSEGNLGLANAILTHLAQKLPISRFQRDLTDSTVLRNLGVGFGYAFIGFASLMRGLGKLELNHARLAADLDAAWEVLAEPIQTVMRRYGLPTPYEQLKALTRGKGMTEQTIRDFIRQLDLPTEAKEALLALTPATYIGKAAKLARDV